jgi:asparaginyl-tRNA synthetase
VLVQSPGQKQKWEIQATSVHVFGTCLAEDYPLQKKRHSFEFLRTIAHLRPRTNTQGAIVRVRNALAYATHKFFQERDFLYIHTPIITASDCEGAGAQFLVTTLDPSKPPRLPDGKVDFSKDFFGKPAYLTVSGQLNGEAFACALSDIYTFGPTFRAENSNTSRHLAEFWMIEPEMAFADLNANRAVAEAYLKYTLAYVLEHCPEEMEFFDQFIEKGVIDRLKHVVATPFAHLSYTQAVDILQKADRAFQFPVSWGSDLQSEHERYLAEEYCKCPVVLTDYPKEIKSFYMRANDDGKTVAAMDVLVPKIGEIIGGSQREERADLLEQKILSFGLDPQNYEWYTQLRKYGTVPHAGFGAGFERLVLFATGMENIRDVIPFPRFPGHAEF